MNVKSMYSFINLKKMLVPTRFTAIPQTLCTQVNFENFVLDLFTTPIMSYFSIDRCQCIKSNF